MAIGALETELDLSNFIRQEIDRQGIPQALQTAKSALDQAVLKLAASADRRAAFGVATLTLPALAVEGAVVVAHGLPDPPLYVFTNFHRVASPYSLVLATEDYTATGFTLSGRSPGGGAVTGSFSVEWLAVG